MPPTATTLRPPGASRLSRPTSRPPSGPATGPRAGPLRAADRNDARRWGRDPVAFAREVLGINLWTMQQDIARALRDHPRVAVRSCHAAGKTLVAAVSVCWFLYTRPGAIVLTTASTFRQVRYVLWRTIQGLVRGAPRPLGGALFDTELRLGERWYGLGLSTNHPERFQGFHAPHLLVVVDEPGAVPPDVFAAIEGVLAAGHTRLLMIGNPTQPHGPFYDAFHSQAAAYRGFRISAFDTPNFTATPQGPAAGDAPAGTTPHHYLVSPDWVASRRVLWGADSDLYRSRVLGEFPRRAADGLISLAVLDAATVDAPAQEDAPDTPRGPIALGVDVARYGDDATAFSWIESGRLVRQDQYHGLSLMETAGRVIEALHDRPDLTIAIDDTGLGGGVTDRLREQGVAPLAVNFGAAARERDYYANTAAELYSRLARALSQGELQLQAGLPGLDALSGQLTTVRYSVGSDGRRRLHKRGAPSSSPGPSAGGPSGAGGPRGASPDLADSLALAWAAYEDGAYRPFVG